MKLNAFKVCHEVADRIDGAIAPDGYMKVYESLCYMWDRVFFWNSKYLKHYTAHKDQNKMIVTGINLINKKLDWYLLCNKNRVTHRVTEKQFF